MHVIVDGRRREAPQGAAWTEAAVEEFIDRAILHAGMLCISGPTTKQFEGQIYGIGILAESHVAAHLDLLRGVAYTELFSCRDFDADGFVHLAVTAFGLMSYRTRLLDRELYRGGPGMVAEPSGAAT